VERGGEGVDVVREHGLEVAAGIRQPMREFVKRHPGHRLIDSRFMEIQQALGTTKNRAPETLEFLGALIEELKASGYVAEALQRSNQPDATVAPPSGR
jgi:polar amino acid transport system substrate-binding protein